jgi:hypothetical protein
MKRITYLALLLLPLLFTSCGTPNSVAGFYQKHKRKKGVKNFKLPGWVMWVGTGLAHEMVDDEDTKLALRFAKKVKKLRVMIAEENTEISSYDVKSFVNEIKQKDYEDLIYVRDGETTVNTLVKDKNGKLKDLVFLVKDEEEFVFLSMKSNIKVEDITELIKNYLGKITKDEADEAKSRKKKKKKKKEKPPQA